MRRLIFVAIVCLARSAAANPTPSRFALIVGNNTGLNDEVLLRYAESDAQKIGKVLSDLGGFESANIQMSLNSSASEVLRAVSSMKTRAQAAIDKPVIFFYYSGHADANDLHLAGTKLKISELTQALTEIDAKVSITLIDACKSGSFTRIKGAVPGPAYDISLAESGEVAGRIVITSSSGEEVAQESDKLEGSFFTHYWVTGLYGSADANGDGLVTLEEAYRFAHYRTVERTIESRGGIQHPGYSFSLSGQGNIVFANLSRASALLRVDAGHGEYPYFVLDAQRQLVLTEVIRTSGSVASVRLPPGRYQVRKREPARILSANVTLAAGQTVALSDKDMSVTAYEGPSAKGMAAIDFSNGPRLRAGVRNGFVRGMSAAPELSIGYVVELGLLFLEPRFIWRSSTYLSAPDTGFHHYEYDFGLTLGIAKGIANFVFAGGLDAGLLAFDDKYFQPPQPPVVGITLQPPPQSPVKGSLSLSVSGSGFGEVSYRLVSSLYLSAYVKLGIMHFTFDSVTRSAFVASGGAGLTFLIH